MSEIHAKGGRLDPFLTRLNMKTQEKIGKIWVKVWAK